MSQFVLEGMASSGVSRIDYAKELNQEQLEVVLHGEGACLVLAGAGSGKTRTLTYRVAYLLEQGVNPSEILLLTFTNKAAREMLQRVGTLMGQGSQGIWGGTFHSVASRILRSFAEPLGYRPNFSILDTEDSHDLMKSVMKDMQLDPKTKRVPSAAVAHSLFSYARNTQRPIEACLAEKHPNFMPLLGDLVELAAQYQSRKKAANAMDFDDLLSILVLLLEDPVMSEPLAQSFRYVLVDEYQDTNALQARIVKGFSRIHRNILVVGDDAQSIYAFRGADVQNILAFPNLWPDAKVFKLLSNYRSTNEILEVANESLAHNEHQFQKELVSMVTTKGKKPSVVPCMSTSQEAQYIAEQILALQRDGRALSQIAILFRSSAHSQSLEFELMKRDLPYEYRGGQKFFERAHIKDVISFLRIYGNVHDEVAWMRVLGLQTGIGATTASNLAKLAMRGEVFQQVIASPEMEARAGRGKVGWKEFIRIGEEMLIRAPYPAAMIRAICDSPYQQYLEREYPNWKERLEDLEQLAAFAESYEELSRFLADISLYDEVVAARDSGEAVERERLVLSTIHQAKGLEWDVVFIVHLVDTAFPNRRALAEAGGMEEERRLFYVAVTRARRELFLTYPLTMGYDSLMFLQQSTFLEEVSPRLFERVELVQRRPSSLLTGGAVKRPWEWQAEGEDGEGVDAPFTEEAF